MATATRTKNQTTNGKGKPPLALSRVTQPNKMRPAKPKNLVAILADPVFTKDGARLKLLAKQSTDSGSTNGAAIVMREVKITPPPLRSDFGRLRFSRLEADAISALARNGQKFVAMDFAANLQAANGEEFQKSGIVHLATHGIINSDFPELSEIGVSPFDAEGDEKELKLHCLDDCLKDLPTENREIIVGYYQGEKREKIENRERLAAKLGVPNNALRNRAVRLRDKLESCIRDCLRKA